MKKILILAIISSIIMTSCYDNYNTYFYIENQTNSIITCKFYPVDSSAQDNINRVNKVVIVDAGSTIKAFEVLSYEGIAWLITPSEVDSIEIVGYQDSSYFMYPDEYGVENNTMFLRENWVQEVDDHDYSYTYQFK